ncbi:flagellar hook protein FlgE [Sphingomonas xinjiangensis]|uniref:Flagellar hook protein FlgE n=1 Tax=Sphingomonas xinjiangensis TaxID=643568 RepID=A0A840YQR4_9SPHN|nr:flagellar hook protein FlgE [Sphingomonas xinjiangensis]MBB5710783.1 flagellar hook protein FlgE [Sphingomonas xinjiangensis]
MSLYSALYAGVSGLSAQSAAMATVADNITNINTVGYKGVEAQFRTLVTDGRAKANYSAGGVAAAPTALVSKQGLLQASGSSTDLAIDGGGFFVTRTGTGDDSSVSFTRAGSFKQDEEGFLRNSSGLYLQGWRIDNSGSYQNTGSLDQLEPVRVSDLVGTASPTTRLQMRANLQTDAVVGTPEGTFTRPFEVYDSQGGAHTLTTTFTKTAPNNWTVTISSPDATPTQIATGTMVFNGDGSLKSITGLDQDAATGGVQIKPNWVNANADAEYISLQFGTPGDPTAATPTPGGIDGITQFGGVSSVVSSNVNGGLLGNLVSVDVSKSGRVNAIFDDGSTREVFQLPIATFQNPDGLTRLSGNAYTVSKASGGVTLNEPGSLGAGDIASSSLEASTVDLASEFTNMIRFQRAYSASSKIITTVDDMLREVSDLKR